MNDEFSVHHSSIIIQHFSLQFHHQAPPSAAMAFARRGAILSLGLALSTSAQELMATPPDALITQLCPFFNTLALLSTCLGEFNVSGFTAGDSSSVVMPWPAFSAKRSFATKAPTMANSMQFCN